MPTSREVFQRITALGFELPPGTRPGGRYDTVTLHGGIAYTSGQLSRFGQEGEVITGRMKAGASLDEANRAARICVIRGLTALHEKIGDLSRIEKFLFVRGFINAEADFSQHSRVMDQASELIQQLFGAGIGAHSRSALGAGSLPAGGLVEIELTVAVKS